VSAFAFGDFLVDAESRRVTHGGDVVAIPDRHVGVLLHLLAHAGSVVSKNGLIESAWSGLAVTDNRLEQSSSGLRKALGDGLCGWWRGAMSYNAHSVIAASALAAA
jgi:DNA-binding winged helix-turn-helix (wHTH) protein